MSRSVRKQAIAGLVTVLALVAGVGVWGSLATLAGAVIAEGKVEPVARAQVVQHQDGGIVASIGVQDGDTVRAGDILLSLDGSDLRASHAIVSQKLVEMGARAARLQAEQIGADAVRFPEELLAKTRGAPDLAEVLDGQVTLFDARLRSYKDSVQSLREQQKQKASEIVGLQAQNAALDEQIALIASELEDFEALLAKSLTSASRVAEIRRTRANLIGQRASSQAWVAAGNGRIAELETEILRLTSTRQQEAVSELREVETKVSELSEQAKAMESAIARLDLRAPLDGIVHRLAIHTIGSVVRPADPVMYIIPQDDALTILAQIDPRQVDSIRIGQAAILRFTSFDARTTPELRAEVTLLSADAMTDERSGARFYMAELAPEPEDLKLLEGKAILPGMPVEIHIQTGGRSPLSYMFKPFTDYVTRAFRD